VDKVALNELTRIPGVLAVEPFRMVPGKLIKGVLIEEVGILGVPLYGKLRRFFNEEGKRFTVPKEGLVLSTTMAKELSARVGHQIWFEATIGRKPNSYLPVIAIRDTYVGASAYMSIHALNRLMMEADLVSGAALMIDQTKSAELNRYFKDIPMISGISFQDNARQVMEKTMSDSLGPMTFFNTLFASLIAVGIVYSSAKFHLRSDRESSQLCVF
jgi:putative ABC transport system permease protein